MFQYPKPLHVAVFSVACLALLQQVVRGSSQELATVTTTESFTGSTTFTWFYATLTTSIVTTTTILLPTAFSFVDSTTTTTTLVPSTVTTTVYQTAWTWALYDIAGFLSLTLGMLLGATTMFAALERREVSAPISILGIMAIGGVTLYVNYTLFFTTFLVGLLIGIGSYLIGTYYRRFLAGHFKTLNRKNSHTSR